MYFDAAGIVIESKYLVCDVTLVLAAMYPVDSGNHGRLIRAEAPAHLVMNVLRLDRLSPPETVDLGEQQTALAARGARGLAAHVLLGRRQADMAAHRFPPL